MNLQQLTPIIQPDFAWLRIALAIVIVLTILTVMALATAAKMRTEAEKQAEENMKKLNHAAKGIYGKDFKNLLPCEQVTIIDIALGDETTEDFPTVKP